MFGYDPLSNQDMFNRFVNRQPLHTTLKVEDNRQPHPKPQLPDSISIGTIRYKVERSGEIDGNMARVRYDTNKIQLDNANSDESNRSAIVHEAVHIILWQAGLFEQNNDETLVQALEYGIVRLIRENPDLIRYIQEQDE